MLLIYICSTLRGRNKIQNDLDKLEKWAETRGKYKVTYLGNRDEMQKYRMGNTQYVMYENDVGIIVVHRMNMSQQSDIA